MQLYVKVSGLVFLLILLAHGARVALEGFQVLMQAPFLISSLIAGGLAGWAIALWRADSRRRPPEGPEA
jgi:hypothetical protein